MRKVRTRDERYDRGRRRAQRRPRDPRAGRRGRGVLPGRRDHRAGAGGMIEHSGIAAVRVPIAGLTRVSHTVYETSTGHEFRFTPEGPEVTEAECHNCLEVLSIIDGDWFVASGSLARGMPADFYAQRGAAGEGARRQDGPRQLGRRPAPGAGRGRVPGQAEQARARAPARAQGRHAGRGGGPGARGGRQRPGRDRGADAGRATVRCWPRAS